MSLSKGKKSTLTEKFEKELQKFCKWADKNGYQLQDPDDNEIEWSVDILKSFEEPGRNKLEKYLEEVMKNYSVKDSDDNEIEDFKLLAKEYKNSKKEKKEKPKKKESDEEPKEKKKKKVIEEPKEKKKKVIEESSDEEPKEKKKKKVIEESSSDEEAKEKKATEEPKKFSKRRPTQQFLNIQGEPITRADWSKVTVNYKTDRSDEGKHSQIFYDKVPFNTKDLEKILGKPKKTGKNDDNWRYEWALVYKSKVYSLYDWSDTNEFHSPGKIKWNLSSEENGAPEEVIKYLEDKIKKLEIEETVSEVEQLNLEELHFEEPSSEEE